MTHNYFFDKRGSKPPSTWKMNVFIVLQMNTFGLGKNTLCTSDKRFSAEDEPIKNMCSNFRPRQLHVYTVATGEFQAKIHSRLLLTGIYLRKWVVTVLTCEYAASQVIYTSILC